MGGAGGVLYTSLLGTFFLRLMTMYANLKQFPKKLSFGTNVLYDNKSKVALVFGKVMYRFGRAIARWNRKAIQMIMS